VLSQLMPPMRPIILIMLPLPQEPTEELPMPNGRGTEWLQV
jgi:hypothetical protein